MFEESEVFVEGVCDFFSRAEASRSADAQVFKWISQQPKNATCHGMKRKIKMKTKAIENRVLLRTRSSSLRLSEQSDQVARETE